MKRFSCGLCGSLAVALLLVGCGSSSSSSDNTGDVNIPTINPADFVTTIDNPYFTLKPGTVWNYTGVDDEGEAETIRFEVTNDTKTIQGVSMTVVRDRVWVENELVEDTYDWYAQDKDGNVWYFGETVDNYEDGVLEDHEGSWEAGVDGASAGIYMFANPEVGKVYVQEYWDNKKGDMAEVLSVTEEVNIGLGAYTNCLKTKDWSPLEPEIIENKYYCKDVGNVVLERKVAGETGNLELIEVIKP